MLNDQFHYEISLNFSTHSVCNVNVAKIHIFLHLHKIQVDFNSLGRIESFKCIAFHKESN